jgi:5-methyltetrahydrofolate--homocysteine methyltransferase
MDDILKKLAICIERGKEKKDSPYPPDLKGQDGVWELTAQALKSGCTPDQILQQGMMVGMNKIGERFSAGKAFIPELLIAAKAMYAGMDVLRPYFESGEVKRKGTIIVGTVAGDLHDIGKNIVRMVLEGAGWKVIDLGVDTTTDKFATALSENPDSIIGMSALLTTTMANMESSIKVIKEKSPTTKIFVGGAPVTEEFRIKVGADGYFADPHQFALHLDKAIINA